MCSRQPREGLKRIRGATLSLSRDGNLQMSRGRRPAWELRRVHADTFYVRDEPYRRVIFHRDGKGNVERFQLLRAWGPSTWFARTGDLPGDP
jgi:hypothetical protein